MSIFERIPRKSPTLEDSIRELTEAAEVGRYAPPSHRDHLTATTKIMLDAIDKACKHTEDQIGKRIVELRERMADVERIYEAFTANMHEAAQHLKDRISESMGNFDDVIAKMTESPFKQKPNLAVGKGAHAAFVDETLPPPSPPPVPPFLNLGWRGETKDAGDDDAAKN